jgi:hypothetical protein
MSPRLLRRRPLAVLPIIAVSLVTAAGCGGSDDADFVDGYNSAVQPLSTLMQDVQPADASDPKSAADSLNKMADGLENVHTKLSDLDAPEDAQDELDRLLTSLEKGTAQVRDMAAAAENGNLEKLSSATQDFSKTGTDLVAAEQQLRTAVEG